MTFIVLSFWEQDGSLSHDATIRNLQWNGWVVFRAHKAAIIYSQNSAACVLYIFGFLTRLGLCAATRMKIRLIVSGQENNAGKMGVDPPNSWLDWAGSRWEVREEQEVGVDKREWGEQTSAEEESISTDCTSNILIQWAWRELATEALWHISLSWSVYPCEDFHSLLL